MDLSLGDVNKQLQGQTQLEMLPLLVYHVCDMVFHDDTFRQIWLHVEYAPPTSTLPFLLLLFCIGILCFPGKLHVYFQVVYTYRVHVSVWNLGIPCERALNMIFFLPEIDLIHLIWSIHPSFVHFPADGRPSSIFKIGKTPSSNANFCPLRLGSQDVSSLHSWPNLPSLGDGHCLGYLIAAIWH